MKITNPDMEIKESTVTVGEDIIKVKTYLPTEDKIKLLEAFKQEVLNEILVNTAKAEALFEIYLIMGYSDVEFEDTSTEALLKAYDFLAYNGYVDVILGEIPTAEYENMMRYATTLIEDYNTYKNSGAGTIESMLVNMPTIMEDIKMLQEQLSNDDLSMARAIYNALGRNE